MSRPARAQSARTAQFERTLEQIRRDTRLRVSPDVPAGQRALVDYGGYFTASYLSFDDQRDDNHAFRGFDLVGYGRVDFDGVHDFFVRGRSTYQDFNPGDSFNGEPDHLEGRLEEAYYRFDLARSYAAYGGRSVDDTFVLQAGRQFQQWANGLVLSQYVDGLRLDLARGPWGLELLAGVTTYGTVDFDSSRPEFDDETYRGFFGGMLSARLGRHRPFIYAIAQRDFNSSDSLDVGLIHTEFEYNSYYLGAGANGSFTDRLVYAAEAVYEGGRAKSNSFDPTTFRPVNQTNENVSAFAADVQLDYLFNDPRRTRLGAGVTLATGDSDRVNSSNTFGGNRPGTDDHGFNALGFINDGLAFSPTVSNLIVVRGTASTYPFPDRGEWLKEFQFGAEAFVFNKFRRTGPIDEPTADERYLGFEPDLFVNWQLTDDVTLTFRYGVFFPGDDAFASGGARQFFYSGLTYAF